MKLLENISLFHRQRTGQLNAEDQKVYQEQRDDALYQELDELWAESKAYKTSYEPDVDKGFSRLKFRMEADKAREAKTVQLRTETRSWLRIAAAIALLVTAGGYWFFSQNSGSEGYVYTTAEGEQMEVNLPDGSTVYLNEGSYVSFETLNGERKVSFTGEAFFEVASNPEQPFVIQSNGVYTTVLGTAFNLRAYPNEPTVEVEVTEGLVRMEEPQATSALELRPKERGVFNMDAQKLFKKAAPELNAQGWRHQKMVFRDVQLAEALKEIERYYRVDIRLKNKKLQDCALSTEINADPLPTFLEVLETVYGLEIRQTGPDRYTLSGGRCNN